jgi:type I restriction enzyme S subunit
MEVTRGYKRTELGAIPADWEVEPVGRIVERLDAGVSVNSVEEVLGSYALSQSVLKTSAVTEGRFLPHECKKIAPRDLSRVSLQPRADTILISRMNTPALVGECGYVEEDYEELFLPDRLWMTKKRPESDASIRWLSYMLSSDPQKARLKALATGTSGSMKNLAKRSLLDLLIPVPPPHEQRTLATALSDLDALLGGLDQLIAKKRDLKQAAMQQLLTGQIRLPGFHAEWRVKRLDELGAWRGGMTPSMQNPAFWQDGDVPWISSGDVKSVLLRRTGFSITSEAVRHGATTLLPAKAIVVVTRSGILRKYLPVAMNVVPMAINQDIKALIPAKEFCGSFLLHTLIGNGDRILASCLKAGTTVESVEFRWLKAFTVLVPKTIAEETAIAAVLSDMDSELSALETRRDKTRDLKQAMMQELLTGKTRLVPAGAAHA